MFDGGPIRRLHLKPKARWRFNDRNPALVAEAASES